MSLFLNRERTSLFNNPPLKTREAKISQIKAPNLLERKISTSQPLASTIRKCKTDNNLLDLKNNRRKTTLLHKIKAKVSHIEKM